MGTVFCIRYRQNGKRVWQNLPGVRTFSEAKHAALLKQMELYSGVPAAPKPGPSVTVKPVPPIPVVVPTDTLGRAIDKYLQDALDIRRRPNSVHGYKVALSQFYASCNHKPLAEICRQDLLDYVRYLHKRGNRDITIHTKIVTVKSLLKANGHPPIKFSVKYTPRPVISYHQDELEKLFSVASKEEALLYKFFLSSGARESEVSHAVWDQIDFTDKIFRIWQTDDFNPKSSQNRDVPLPDFLLAELKQRLLTSTGTLIFPNRKGRVNHYMLKGLKKLAARAELGSKFGLHTFRRTFATLQHQNGVDSRSVQVRLGHASLATKTQYFGPDSERVTN